MDLNRETLQEAVHEALRGWHSQGAPPATALDELLLVQERREELTEAGNPLALHLATNQLLLELLELLEKQDETGAQVLRWRFLDDDTLLRVAHRLNVSEHTVSRLQRAALDQLAAIVMEQEMALRDAIVHEREGQLPPPTYTHLFGIEAQRAHLANLLLEPEGPAVTALVGIGGIGKTALADAVTRDLIRAVRFDRVIWLRYETRTMSGQALSPQHAFEAVLSELAARLGLESDTAPAGEQFAAVRHRLKGARHLVVVDNLEREAVADYLLNHLVGLTAPSKFLLTTRARPSGQAAVRHLTLPELSLPDAGRLLRHHAREVGVAHVAQAGDEEVERIYDVTGGNPLALKLVVGLLDLLPLGQVLADLTRSRSGPVEELYRHIYWQSWRTLSEPARTLLQAMPLVSESGGEPEYLQAISGLDEEAFWPALSELRSRSLLEVRGTLADKRYGVHRLTETFVRTEIIHWTADA
ncbi:MAG: NB-ARC domain-containing protein [Candidatus Promineifilaceae bacterium]|nr:NB-ARC domain-containing protein [Candidatus Promineifilaceae bacterium]